MPGPSHRIRSCCQIRWRAVSSPIRSTPIRLRIMYMRMSIPRVCFRRNKQHQPWRRPPTWVHSRRLRRPRPTGPRGAAQAGLRAVDYVDGAFPSGGADGRRDLNSRRSRRSRPAFHAQEGGECRFTPVSGSLAVSRDHWLTLGSPGSPCELHGLTPASSSSIVAAHELVEEEIVQVVGPKLSLRRAVALRIDELPIDDAPTVPLLAENTTVTMKPE